jgi:PAS domain S-box-containing protein
MPTAGKSDKDIRIEELELRLAEAEDALRAIREGEVDAVIVSGTRGEQIFSLVGPDSIYRLIVETMKEAAFTVTFDGKILFCNVQFGELVKRPLERVIGHPLHEFVDESARTLAASLLVSARQQSVKQRLVFQDLNCTPVPAYVSTSVLNQPDGVSICVVATDLTELENSTELIQKLRRQQEALQATNEELAATEEELRVQNEELSVSRAELDRTRARYQDLFETAPDGYIVTDSVGTIQEANRAAGLLLGQTAGELRGNPFSALLPSTERENYRQRLASLNADAPLPKWEVEIRPLESPHFWASVTAAAAIDEAGQIVGLRWLIRDVTDRKQAEEALAQKSKDLSRTNKELEYFNKMMVGRELRMIELKKEIDKLCRQFGQPTRYGYGDDGLREAAQP